MKKINTVLIALIAFHFSLFTPMSAQDQKRFTLEDLNFGGVNYRNPQPKNLWVPWWGDQLMYQDAEEGGIIAKDKSRTALFTLDEVNATLKTEPSSMHSAFMAEYPYADQSLVLLSNDTIQILYDFRLKQTKMVQHIQGTGNQDWNKTSRAIAYTKDWQLYVRDANDQEYQLSSDGSREMVYGQSVHRDEFGIYKGTFWSPDGQKLAFYRMDQSMVADYPQVDIFPREATYEPDKYPMAGMTSHKVTVGVFDLKTQKTIYLQAGDPTDRYFTNITWGPDCKTVYMFELNRDQSDCRLVSYNAGTR